MAMTLTSSTASPMDLIANKSIRSGEMAAYLELRDDILVQAQAQLDQIASAMASSLSSIAMPTITTSRGRRPALRPNQERGANAVLRVFK